MLRTAEYELRFIENTVIDVRLPHGTRILDILWTGDCDFALHVVTDPTAPKIVYRFHLLGPDDPIDDKLYWTLKHLKTIQTDHYLWHIFEEKNYGFKTSAT